MDFATTLKQLRTGKNITQKQLAEKLGVTKSVISFYENGERFPSYDILIKIATHFHVSTDYLLGLSSTKALDVSNLSDEDIALLQQVSDRLRKNKRK